MKPVIAVAIVCAALTLAAAPHPPKSKCPCGDTRTTTHVRMAVKNRPLPPQGAIDSAQALTVAEALTWQAPDPPPEKSPTATTLVPQEQHLRTLVCYVRLAKRSPDDCDYHLEVADVRGGERNRMICEIPNTTEYCGLRAELLKALGLKKLSSKRTFGKDRAPRLSITGYPFFDIAHASPKHHSGSKDVATSWELHPVVRVANVE